VRHSIYTHVVHSNDNIYIYMTCCHYWELGCVYVLCMSYTVIIIYIYDMYGALAENVLQKMWERGGVDGGSWGVCIYIEYSLQPIAIGV